MLCFVLALAGLGCGSGVLDASPNAASGGAAVAVFQVASFGAKGDGVADDGPAIQRALSAAATAGGGVVSFPCGQFRLGSVAGAAPGARSALYLKGAKSVQIRGQMQGAGSCTHLYTALPQKSVVEFEDSTQIAVSNLKITALNAPYVETYGMDGGAAVRFTGVSHGSIGNVEVDGASAGAFYLTKGTSNVTVANNYVHNTFGAGIWEDDCGSANAQNCEPSVPPSNNSYTSNTFTDTAQDALAAISLDDGSGLVHATVTDNKVSWTRAPLTGKQQVHCIQVNNASFVDVVNNTCSGTPWDGIVVTTGPGGKIQNVTIQGNTIQSSGTSAIGGSGIVVYDAPKGLGIRGFNISYNTVSTAGDDGIGLYAASQPGNIANGQVQNNTVTLVDQRLPGSRFGIDIEYSAGIQVSSNAISCNGTCIAVGVNVNASSATAPTAQSNQVTDILGQALLIH